MIIRIMVFTKLLFSFRNIYFQLFQVIKFHLRVIIQLAKPYAFVYTKLLSIYFCKRKTLSNAKLVEKAVSRSKKNESGSQRTGSGSKSIIFGTGCGWKMEWWYHGKCDIECTFILKVVAIISILWLTYLLSNNAVGWHANWFKVKNIFIA